MELLTDKKAGVKDKKNHYPKDTINYLVQKRIDKLNNLRKTFAAGNKVPGHNFSRKNELKS
ncbi:MAG: hypothetical protein KAT61_09685, partial [Gammaproteobacteria bacterium]|nr:hypothetical protein [Gammaproteobacteria bacterium]